MVGAWSFLPGGVYEKQSFYVLLIVFLFAIVYGQVVENVNVYSTIATGAPLAAYWMLSKMRQYFIKKHGRAPMDTAVDDSDGLFQDRLFNFLAVMGPILILGSVFVLFFELFVRS